MRNWAARFNLIASKQEVARFWSVTLGVDRVRDCVVGLIPAAWLSAGGLVSLSPSPSNVGADWSRRSILKGFSVNSFLVEEKTRRNVISRALRCGGTTSRVSARESFAGENRLGAGQCAIVAADANGDESKIRFN